MRHFYFRLILGIVFAACMIFSYITMNIPFTLLYLALGVAFLLSAYSLWKNEKDNRGQCGMACAVTADLTEKELSTSFDFSGDEKRKKERDSLEKG